MKSYLVHKEHKLNDTMVPSRRRVKADFFVVENGILLFYEHTHTGEVLVDAVKEWDFVEDINRE